MVLYVYEIIVQILFKLTQKLDWPQTWERSASRTPRRTRRRIQSRGRWSWWEPTRCKPGQPSRTRPTGWRRARPWEGCRHELAWRCTAGSECPRPPEGLAGCQCTRMDPKTGSSRCRCSRLMTQPSWFYELTSVERVRLSSFGFKWGRWRVYRKVNFRLGRVVIVGGRW